MVGADRGRGMTEQPPSLRLQGLSGVKALLGREAGGIVIRLAGTVALTQLLGPRDFGTYAGSTAVLTFLAALAQLSVEIWVVRAAEAPQRAALRTLNALLLASSAVVVAATAVVVLGVVAVTGRQHWLAPFLLLLAFLPANVLWAPAQGLLERDLRFRDLGRLEVAGDVVLYGVGAGLVAAGFGIYGAVLGYIAWQLFLVVGSRALARAPLSLGWDRQTAADAVRFGTAAGAGGWTSRLQELVNPLVVGAFAGAAAVGVVALALRIVQTLGLANRVAYRISYPLLARLRAAPAQLVAAVEQGSQLQVLGTGIPLLGFAILSRWLVPLAFGAEWRPVLRVLPLVSLGTVLYSGLLLPASALVLLGANRRVMAASLARLAVLAGVSAILLPSLGAVGYSVAAAAAVLPYLPLRRALGRVLSGAPGPTPRAWLPVLRCVTAVAPGLSAAVLPLPLLPLALLPLLLLVGSRAARADLLALRALAAPRAPRGVA
jgi:PST family polysaccharide transporter